MTQSSFQKELEVLMATKCEECHGSGECNDAEPGDIYHRTWTCPRCGGTGKRREVVAEDEHGPLHKDDLDANALRDGVLKRKEGP